MPGRKTWWAIAVVLVILVALVVWFVTRSDSSSDDASAGPATSAPTPQFTGHKGGVKNGLKPAPTPKHDPRPVKTSLGDSAELGTDVSAQVVKIESVQGQARGPGEVAGPSVRFTIELANHSSSSVDLRGAVVTAFAGTHQAPAPELSGPGVDPFPEAVAAGQKAQGTYVFKIPVADRDHVVVEVSYAAGKPHAVFEGSAS